MDTASAKPKIYIGADHRGYALKEKIEEQLKAEGYQVEDVGDTKLDPNDDYPQYAGRCAVAVLSSDDIRAKGILICGSGQGMCMAANRYRGIRAALAHSSQAVWAARNDDDANIICIPADLFEKDGWQDLVKTFVDTPFAAASRYLRRVKEMDDVR